MPILDRDVHGMDAKVVKYHDSNDETTFAPEWPTKLLMFFNAISQAPIVEMGACDIGYSKYFASPIRIMNIKSWKSTMFDLQ